MIPVTVTSQNYESFTVNVVITITENPPVDAPPSHTGSRLASSTTHFSAYGVGYRKNVPVLTNISGHFAKDNIEFAVNRGLLSGTGRARRTH